MEHSPEKHENGLALRVMNELRIMESTRLAVPVLEGVNIIRISDIIRLEASNNYTYVYLVNEQKHVISRSLSKVAASLPFTAFVRIHKSHLINLFHLNAYAKGGFPRAIMCDKDGIPISRRKLPDFLTAISEQFILL
ncbi:MAG: LytTR family DNA-binding domain-containing protein [Bacteroidota bacterium]